MFNLTLPDNFNGRYVYLGIGGAAGKIPEMPQRLLARGFALAGSDGGTGAKSIADFSFMSDPARLTDFMWRGVQSSAEATQAITRAYYGREKLWRYISGCSGGGQMGLGNARRFGGRNFDGFLVGATPFQASLFHPNVFGIAAHMQNNPESWISPELMRSAGAGILAAYDDLDGAHDGIIHDPTAITQFRLWHPAQGRFQSRPRSRCSICIWKTHKFPSGGTRGDGTHPGWPISDVSGWSRFLLGTMPPPWPGTNGRSPADLLKQGVPFIHIMSDTKTRVDGARYRLLEDRELQRSRAHILARRRRHAVHRPDGLFRAGRQRRQDDHLARRRRRIDELSGIAQAGYEVLRARFPDGGPMGALCAGSRPVALPGRHRADRPCRSPARRDHPLGRTGQGPRWASSPTGCTYEGGRERSMLLCTEPRHAFLKAPGWTPRMRRTGSAGGRARRPAP